VNARETAIGPGTVGLELGPVAFEWTERDAILYALGIGARHPDDLAYLYEGGGLRVEPTFALCAVSRMLPPLVAALDIDLLGLLHGTQSIELHRVPAPAGACSVTRRVTGAWDKGRAAIVDCEDVVADDEGPLATAHSSWWVEGAGGFGGPRSAPDRPPRIALPDRAPDLALTRSTTTEQAALYRLSGDLNPVHIDPEFARASGQPGAFLHGLCTFGLLAHALEIAAGPGRRLTSIGARFTRPVFPGCDLDIAAWWEDGDAAVAQVSVDGDRVLGPARATFANTS
jgi:acyl dehydratase